jgi:RHS repeat-associated protein
VVNAYAYTPFGQIANESETVEQPFRFGAQFGVMTEPNGLYYMKARYYDSGVGRFISEDPLGFNGGNINLYVYAANNPIMFMDPNGLCINAISDYLGDVFTAPNYESLRAVTSQAAASAGLYIKGGLYEPTVYSLPNRSLAERMEYVMNDFNQSLDASGLKQNLIEGGPLNPIHLEQTFMWLTLGAPAAKLSSHLLGYPRSDEISSFEPFGHSHHNKGY